MQEDKYHKLLIAQLYNQQGELTTWNLTWRHMDLFLRPAVPDMNVLRMLPTRRSVFDPSMPTMEPLTSPPTGAFTLLNSSLMFDLQKQCLFV